MFGSLKPPTAKPVITDAQAEVLIAGSSEELKALKQKLWVAILTDTATEAEIRQYELLRRRLTPERTTIAH